MKIFPFQRLWIVGITLGLSAANPDCDDKPANHPKCPTTAADQTKRQTLSSTETLFSTTIHQTTTDQNGSSTTTTTQKTDTNDTTTKTTVQTTNTAIQGTNTNASSITSTVVGVNQTTAGNIGSKTTVIVAASVGTCAAIILAVILVLIRRRHILLNCNLPHKQPDAKKSTSFNNNMYPDIEGTSDDSRYAEIPLDNVDSIKAEDNVYQTIDPLQEQETVIDDQYSRIISGNAWPLTNAPYSHVAGDFQNKPVVPDSHIAKLEGTPNGGLKFKTNESDKSYDIIGNTKFGVTEELKLMDPTYNHTENETYQAETATSDVDNYSHLHGLNKVTQFIETMTYNKHHEPFTGNPNRNKEHGLCLKESDIEQKSIDKKEENNTAEVVKLPEKSKFSLGENNEENAVDHQYFVLENVDKTEEKEPPAVINQPEAKHVFIDRKL